MPMPFFIHTQRYVEKLESYEIHGGLAQDAGRGFSGPAHLVSNCPETRVAKPEPNQPEKEPSLPTTSTSRFRVQL